jgi:hypothetical protein
VTEHPITPPPELVGQWLTEAADLQLLTPSNLNYLATQAARWGADQELEACCLELVDGIGRSHAEFPSCLAEDLRAARRPKPPSWREQALARLTSLEELAESMGHSPDDTIRRALEALPDD